MSKKQSEPKGKIFNIDRQSKKFYPNPKPVGAIIGITPFHAIKMHVNADPAYNKQPYQYILQAA